MISEGEPLAFGDVILVPFPFTNQTTSKRRPAVVVSASDYSAQHGDVIIMAITSQLRVSAKFGEQLVQDWKAAGLLKPSAIKPVIATIEQTLVLRRLGKLGKEDHAALRKVLGEILG